MASKNNGLYTPTERLQAGRALFYPVPGQTLGGRKKQVLTQADDPANSAFVENTMFLEPRVVFAALNITGSNNDLTSWGSPLPANAVNYLTQAQEVASRAQANTAWLNKAFALANAQDAVGVVLFMQADMWDPTAALSGFDALVTQIGNLAVESFRAKRGIAVVPEERPVPLPGGSRFLACRLGMTHLSTGRIAIPRLLARNDNSLYQGDRDPSPDGSG